MYVSRAGGGLGGGGSFGGGLLSTSSPTQSQVFPDVLPFWSLYHNYHMCISVLVSLDTLESIPSVTCNDRMTLSWNRFDKVGDQLLRLVGNSRADVHLLPGCPPRWSHARPWFNQLKCAVVAKKLCSLNEEFWSNYSSDNCKNSAWSLMLMLQLFQLWILYYLFSIDTNY